MLAHSVFDGPLQNAVWPVYAQQPTVTNIDRNDDHIPWTSGKAPLNVLLCCTRPEALF